MEWLLKADISHARQALKCKSHYERCRTNKYWLSVPSQQMPKLVFNMCAMACNVEITVKCVVKVVVSYTHLTLKCEDRNVNVC